MEPSSQNYHYCRQRHRGCARSAKLYVADENYHTDYHSCSATPEGKSLSAEACRLDHILHRGFHDIGYHFYITRDGEIHRGRPLEKVGAHCRNHNSHSIGICYEGGLDADCCPKDTRTLEQRGSLLALLRELRRQFPKALIVGHHDLNPMKECPCFSCTKEYSNI